jgi:hypothetical protein
MVVQLAKSFKDMLRLLQLTENRKLNIEIYFDSYLLPWNQFNETTLFIEENIQFQYKSS